MAAGVLSAAISLLLAGCGQGPPPPTDKDQALKALHSALDAWKKGEKPETVKKDQSIQMLDPAWDKGLKLARYEIEEAHAKPSGFDLGVPVKLWFDNLENEPRTIKYTVSTSPALVITRDYGGF